MTDITSTPHIMGRAAIKAYHERQEDGVMVRVDEENGGSCPSQYGIPCTALELQDLIEHRQMNFSLGNIFKACYRLGHCDHSDTLRDMRKIKWFAGREIARLEKEQKLANAE